MIHEGVTRSKRGLSTIIGALFFMFVVIGALTMMSWASQQQGSFSTTTTEVSRLQLERGVSALEIIDVRIDGNKFNITLQNNGPLTEKIVRLWATNETEANWHNNYEVNYIVNPKQVITNVGQNVPLIADNLDAYKLKLTTERGALVAFRSLSVAQADMKLSMYISPITISTGENVTIMMSVTNNAKDVDSIHDLQPTIAVSSTCVGAGCPPAITPISAPSSIKSLARDSTALFKWTYNVAGPVNSTVTFTGSLIGASPSNSVSDSVSIKPVIADISSITSIIATNTGILTMNFTSFQFCNPAPAGDNCASNSSDWKPGWQVQDDTPYLWRVNVTNNGAYDIYLDTNTAILILQAQSGGGGNLPTTMFIKADSTTTNENPGAYTNYSKILQADKLYYTIYFGVTTAGGSMLQTIPDPGIYAVNLILFGFSDTNDDGFYDSTAPYSQNLPFQGLNAT